MNSPKLVSVVVAIYQDIDALELILLSLYNQSYRDNYEVIIAEDGQSEKVKNFVDTLSYKNLIHTNQQDIGWQKNKSLNNAVRHSSGDLIIFLDGDCVPYSNLIENYVALCADKTVLCGRRVELGEKFSFELRSKNRSLKSIENNYIKLVYKLLKDKCRHYEEGIIFSQYFYRLKHKNKQAHILGCNFAINRADLYAINGFNEEYIWPSIGEDVDIEYRLTNIGCKLLTVRNRCNTLHLYHEYKYDEVSNQKSRAVLNRVKMDKEFICKKGLSP
ncbi:MAG: glycosyltransferase [Gammaproteobacteria bacterium]|nr:glycosyltransferase [Gammaproteobacteria bacterium]